MSFTPIAILSPRLFCDKHVKRQSVSQAAVSLRRKLPSFPYQISRAVCVRTLPIGGKFQQTSTRPSDPMKKFRIPTRHGMTSRGAFSRRKWFGHRLSRSSVLRIRRAGTLHCDEAFFHRNQIVEFVRPDPKLVFSLIGVLLDRLKIDSRRSNITDPLD